MSKINVIYRILNKINGKSYIGKAKNFEIRIKEHLRNIDKIKSPLYSAIKSIGLENFNMEIIYEAENYKDLDALEIKFISEYNTLYPNGYNLTYGGSGGDTISNNPNKDESLLKRKGKHTAWNKGLIGHCAGEKNGNYGNPTNFKGNSTSFKSGVDHVGYGKKQSKELVEKRMNNTDWKKRSENFPWEQKARNCMKPIYQYTLEGELIKMWESVTTAYRELGVNKYMIDNAIKRNKPFLNSIWKNKI